MTSPRTVLGVPLLPPPQATAASNRMRSLLYRLDRAAAPPPLQILQGLFGLLDYRAMVALCQAGVPEALTKPTTVGGLAERLDADPAGLGRLLRFCANRGWVRIDRRGRVRPTRVLRFLRRDHPGGWRAWVDFAGGPEIAAAVAGGGFASVHGEPFFDWMGRHPDRSAAFNGAMAAGARMHGLFLDAAFDWSGPLSVCDVGGGTGELLRVLLERHPSLTGAVLDLPSVVASAVAHDRLTPLAGDAFASVPTGYDVYLMVNVLHDWSDADASRLLSSAAAAMGPGARVIALEADAAAWRHDPVAVAADLLMASLTEGGRERTAEEFAVLGAAAGLRLARSVRLASGELAHEFVAAR